MPEHPWAAAQPTATGKRITTLHVHDSRLYAGYGDYGANKGPIHLASLPLDLTGDWTDHHTSSTEAVYCLRTLGGDLFAPATDRRSAADYATDESGSWADVRPVSTTHAYDMAETTEGLWMAGSKGNDAVLWHRPTGGSWAEALRVAPAAGGYNRFYGVGTIGDDVYVQAVNSQTGLAAASKHWDGAWDDGPSLLVGGGRVWRPLPWLTGFVSHMAGHGNNGYVYYFDGTTATNLDRAGYDHAVDNDLLFLLEPDGEIVVTDDGETWALAATVATTARSIAVVGSTAYIGHTDSTVEAVALTLPAEDPPSDPHDPDPLPDPIADLPVTVDTGPSVPRSGRRLLI